MTFELFPIVEVSLFGNYGIAFGDIIDIKGIAGAEDVIETVVNISVFGSDLKWRFSKLRGLRFNLNIALFPVKFLMLELILIEVINFIQLLALKLLRFNQRIIEP